MDDLFAGLTSSGDPVADVAAFLLKSGRPDTLAHCRAVVDQARSLARRVRVHEGMAVLAAHCHDLAAVVPQERAVVVAEGLGILPDGLQRANPVLLHGPIAAAVLPLKLGLDDRDVLNAIRYHTTCRAGASALELLVFVADKMALDPSAPVRDFVPQVCAAAERSLRDAALAYLSWVVAQGPGLGWRVHPDAIAAHQELKATAQLDCAVPGRA